MNKQLFITVTCMLLLAASALAQNVTVGLRAPEENFIMGGPPVTVDLLAPPQGGFTSDASQMYQQTAASPTPEELLQMQMDALSEQLEATASRAAMKGVLRSVWNGQGAGLLVSIGVSEYPDIATAWGISEEQREQIGGHVEAAMEQIGDPMEVASLRILAEMGITEERAKQDDWEPDMETMLRLQAEMANILENTTEQMGSVLNTVITDAFDEFLTPEQLRTIQESQLANIGELPVFSPSIFEALDLTDAQREQMEQIKKELQPDFEETLDCFVDGFSATQERVNEEYIKGSAERRAVNEQLNDVVRSTKFYLREWEGEELAPGESLIGHVGEDSESAIIYVTDQAGLDERQRAIEALGTSEERLSLCHDDILKRLLAEDQMFRQIHEEMQSKSRAFAERFKIEMFDVLTDEQWFRLQELIDNPPEHALVFRKALREALNMGEGEEEEKSVANKGTEKAGVWMPGPNSWKPGDPIPEEYRIKRNERSRFSRETKRSQETEE